MGGKKRNKDSASYTTISATLPKPLLWKENEIAHREEELHLVLEKKWILKVNSVLLTVKFALLFVSKMPMWVCNSRKGNIKDILMAKSKASKSMDSQWG